MRTIIVFKLSLVTLWELWGSLDSLVTLPAPSESFWFSEPSLKWLLPWPWDRVFELFSHSTCTIRELLALWTLKWLLPGPCESCERFLTLSASSLRSFGYLDPQVTFTLTLVGQIGSLDSLVPVPAPCVWELLAPWTLKWLLPGPCESCEGLWTPKRLLELSALFPSRAVHPDWRVKHRESRP